MRKRTIIAVSILLVGVVGAVWLTFGNKTNAGNLDISISAGGENNNARFASTTDSSEIGGGAANMTDDALNQYGIEILKLNPRGVSANKQIAVPGDTVLNNIIIESTNKPIVVSYFVEKDIKVLDTASDSAVKTYLKLFVAADKKNAELVTDFYGTLGNFVAGSDSQKLIDLNNNISSFITTLLAMPVPKNWASFHLTFLNFWKAKLTYAEAFLNKDDDPLLAGTASKSLQALLTQENSIRLDFANRVRGIQF